MHFIESALSKAPKGYFGFYKDLIKGSAIRSDVEGFISCSNREGFEPSKAGGNKPRKLELPGRLSDLPYFIFPRSVDDVKGMDVYSNERSF